MLCLFPLLRWDITLVVIAAQRVRGQVLRRRPPTTNNVLQTAETVSALPLSSASTNGTRRRIKVAL